MLDILDGTYGHALPSVGLTGGFHHADTASSIASALTSLDQITPFPSGSGAAAGLSVHAFGKDGGHFAALAAAMNGDEAFAFAGPTGAAPPAPFLASKYVIDPAHLVTSAKEIALAIAQGYSASNAITLLETASDKANVSFDRMLFLAESQLEALSGAKAIAGEKAFETEIRAHLTSGEAAFQLARDVKTGELSSRPCRRHHHRHGQGGASGIRRGECRACGCHSDGQDGSPEGRRETHRDYRQA